MNVPAIILEMEEYRKKLLSSGVDGGGGGLDEVIADLQQPELAQSDDICERVCNAFTWAVDNLGYDEFKKTAIKLKRMPSLTPSQYREAKGELAEVFLYLTIREYIRIHDLKSWKVFHHLCFPYKSGKKTVELDVVLATPKIIIVFEIKSYNGKKKLTDYCTISIPNGSPFDVFRQNALHCKALWEHIEPYALTDIGAMKSVFFDFSDGSIVDIRTADKKRLMPLVNEDNVAHFLNAVRDITRVAWKNEALEMIELWGSQGYDKLAHINQFV